MHLDEERPILVRLDLHHPLISLPALGREVDLPEPASAEGLAKDPLVKIN